MALFGFSTKLRISLSINGGDLSFQELQTHWVAIQLELSRASHKPKTLGHPTLIVKKPFIALPLTVYLTSSSWSQRIIPLEHRKPLGLNLASPEFTWHSPTPGANSWYRMDLLDFGSEGQPRTLQKTSTGPISPCQGSYGDTPSHTVCRCHGCYLSPFIPKGACPPPATPSAQFQLKNHTPIGVAFVPHCSVFILKADSFDSHFLAEPCNFDLKAIVPWFLFPQITALRCENLTLAPSDTNKWARPCSRGASALARETKPTLASSWKTEQGSK